MKIILFLAFLGLSTIGISQEKIEKKPELKLASEPVDKKEEKKPELKLVDPSTANPQKSKEKLKGKPELKLISK